MGAQFNCNETRILYRDLGSELQGATNRAIYATTAEPELGEHAARLEHQRFDLLQAARDAGHTACLSSSVCLRQDPTAA